jgi:hypothetical protein
LPLGVTPEIADSLGQQKRCRTTGVLPTGAHVLAMKGMRESPLSSTNRSVARRRAAPF